MDDMDDDTDDPTDGMDEKPKKKLSKKEKQALFSAYDSKDEDVSTAETELAAAQSARSAVVKEIFEKCGKGPFKRKGKILTIVKRKDNYYFRSQSQGDVDDLD